MKNTIVSALAAAILAAVLISCFARAADYQSMTDEELLAEANAIRNEQVKRKAAEEEKPVVYDYDGVQVYLTGEYTLYGTALSLEAVVVNDSEISVNVRNQDHYISINGWQCYCGGITDIPSGKRKKGTFMIDLGASDATTYEEIQEIEFILQVADSSSHQMLHEEDPVIVCFN